jgi:hypothetical protein
MKNLLKNKDLWTCVAVSVLLVLVLMRISSSYSLSPKAVEVKAAPGAEGTLLDRPYKEECVPGPTKKAAYYTKSLTPGGVCDGQAHVQASASYTILGGIGGSLLDK